MKRRAKLTPERRQLFLERLKDGHPFATAAHLASPHAETATGAATTMAGAAMRDEGFSLAIVKAMALGRMARERRA